MAVVVAACSGKDDAIASPAQNASTINLASQAEPPRHQVKRMTVGKPYREAGRLYRPAVDWNYSEVGTASWYGSKFHGRKTANGEIFDKNQLTAAHTTLPLPVIVKVTNLENGRSVKVRVNDRGPFAHGRIIDLSQAAAEQLDFIRKGTARVKVEVLPSESQALLKGRPAYADRRPAPTLVAAVPVWEGAAVYLQLGSFIHRGNAYALKQNLKGFGNIKVKPAMVSGKQFYRVHMGPYRDAEAALDARKRLAEAGMLQSHLVFENGS